jgi:hypothetical protein
MTSVEPQLRGGEVLEDAHLPVIDMRGLFF